VCKTWISKYRRCVRDYETKPDHHEAMVHLAMIMLMSRRLTRTTDPVIEFSDAHQSDYHRRDALDSGLA